MFFCANYANIISIMKHQKILLKSLKKALLEDRTFTLVLEDFTTTFKRLGAESEDKARFVALFVITQILRADRLTDAEIKIKNFFSDTKFKEGKIVFDLISDGLQVRTDIIFNQIKPYLQGLTGKVIDFGCGSGTVTQQLKDKLSLDIEGVDVRDFRSKNVNIKINIFNGKKVDVGDKTFDCAVLTNVIHHEAKNENVIKELSRIVKNKLVIIETVPEAKTKQEAKKDWGRMLLNDSLWNRFFNYADIPVPGTYEVPEDWVKRFSKYGWKCTTSIDLGIDQPSIQDRHHLFVFER